MIEQSHRWQRTAVAAAAFALLSFSASQASALSLGRITVQSALGEPLRAEIEIPSISAEEAASLKANAASPAAFVAAGLEYNAAMAGLQVSLARRPDGRAFIRLSSERTINEPFVDMILEASWSSGRIVRDYTMLFDPPSLKQAAAPTLPQTVVAAPAPMTTKPVPAPADAQAVATKPVAASPAPKAKEATDTKKVTVKSGDSASRIASRAKSNDVSLDQMLVALLRSNPDAFTKGNLNRLRAGVVLDMPSAEQAKSVSAQEAAQTVFAQSKDFNEFRRNLAGNAPKTTVESTDRKASGAVEAKVEDKKPGNAAADKLTLSKGALEAKANEAKIAKERAEKDASDRAAELAKNIADLNKLSAASAAKPPAPVAVVASQPASAPKTPALEVVVAPPPVVAPMPEPAVSEPVVAPVMPASAVAKPKPPVPVPAPAAAEPGILDQLMEDPKLPLAGGGLLALLGGLLFYRRHLNKKREAHVDSSFLESRLQPDSFFGASGGQRVDTAQESANGSSSLNYTNSQLGNADDVDPVAEADVYLAYGRDVQAEEILKEAVLHNPERVAIHSKLLDVYAKRGDTINFLASANNALKLVGADSPEWARICALGLSIDPQNSLYQQGGSSADALASLDMPPPAVEPGGNTVSSPTVSDTSDAKSDLDLDLDFSADDVPTYGTPLSASDSEETTKLPIQDSVASNSLDFDISAPAELEQTPPTTPQGLAEATELPTEMAELAQSMDGMSLGNLNQDEPLAFNLELPEFQITDHPSIDAAAAEAPDHSNDGMLEFDLDSLSLDLGPRAEASAEVEEQEDEDAELGDDSLETKLALAEEFVSIGDHDGARALIEEVVAEATGELREKAQQALAHLS